MRCRTSSHTRTGPEQRRPACNQPAATAAHMPARDGSPTTRDGHTFARGGHGTFVAGTIAESTNNRIGATGLAYGASVMPIRVLDRYGTGDAATIARGIRYAVRHHARVINLSLEFTPDVTAADIPDLLGAIRYATNRHVVVVSASGNEGVAQVAYPARAQSVIAVGATT